MRNSDMPAMPVSGGTKYDGLTKREHFAAMAMQGLVSNAHVIEGLCDDKTIKCIYTSIAEYAVKHADALLKALEK